MTATAVGHLAWSPSAHLGVLLGDVERLAGTVDDAVREGGTAPELWDLAVIATCRLDGSGMVATPSGGDVATIVDDDASPEDVMRREYVGVARALGADDLARTLRRDPLKALPALHRMLTSGLVAPSATGRLRRTLQAVHDGNEGRIVFQPVDPSAIAVALPALRDLLPNRGLHPVVTAGLLQFELLRLHPFESANGRLARTAARLVLREAGLDPAGLAVAEIPMSVRRVGNYDVMAAALRSGDLTVWLETWAEDVLGGLRLAAHALDVAPAVRPGDPELLAGLPAAFTVAQVRDEAAAAGHHLDLDEVRALTSRLADADRIRPVSGSRGLRWRQGPADAPAWHRPRPPRDQGLQA